MTTSTGVSGRPYPETTSLASEIVILTNSNACATKAEESAALWSKSQTVWETRPSDDRREREAANATTAGEQKEADDPDHLWTTVPLVDRQVARVRDFGSSAVGTSARRVRQRATEAENRW